VTFALILTIALPHATAVQAEIRFATYALQLFSCNEKQRCQRDLI